MRWLLEMVVIPFISTAFISAVFLVSGCSRTNLAVPTPTSFRHAPSLQSYSSIASSIDYRQARTLYVKGDHSRTTIILKRLMQRPGLSSEDAAFLTAQISLCQKGEGGTFSSARFIPSRTPSLRSDPSGSLQSDTVSSSDCGPRALIFAAKQMGVPESSLALSKITCIAGTKRGDGTNLAGMVKAAKSLGLSAEAVQADGDGLKSIPTPFIAWMDGNHYVTALSVSVNALTGEATVIYQDPNYLDKDFKYPSAVHQSLSLSQFLSRSGGIVVKLGKELAKTKLIDR